MGVLREGGEAFGFRGLGLSAPLQLRGVLALGVGLLEDSGGRGSGGGGMLLRISGLAG